MKKLEIDRVRLRFDEDKIIDQLWSTEKEIRLRKPFKMKAGRTYELVMFNDRSVEVWRLTRTENKYEMQ